MTDTEYLVIITAVNALSYLENHREWNLSLGEQLCCVKAIDRYLKQYGLPKVRSEWEQLFTWIYMDTWGGDHECVGPSDDEIEIMRGHLSDAFEV